MFGKIQINLILVVLNKIPMIIFLCLWRVIIKKGNNGNEPFVNQKVCSHPTCWYTYKKITIKKNKIIIYLLVQFSPKVLNSKPKQKYTLISNFQTNIKPQVLCALPQNISQSGYLHVYKALSNQGQNCTKRIRMPIV